MLQFLLHYSIQNAYGVQIHFPLLQAGRFQDLHGVLREQMLRISSICFNSSFVNEVRLSVRQQIPDILRKLSDNGFYPCNLCVMYGGKGICQDGLILPQKSLHIQNVQDGFRLLKHQRFLLLILHFQKQLLHLGDISSLVLQVFPIHRFLFC